MIERGPYKLNEQYMGEREREREIEREREREREKEIQNGHSNQRKW